MQRILLVLGLFLLSPGCVMVGGYSSGRGFFIWPGTMVILLVVIVLFFLLRRRR